MKAPALRTLSLTLVFTVAIGVWLQHRVVTAARAGVAVTAGEFLVDPPRPINLGFEWFIQGDDNRNPSVDVSCRKQGTTGWKQEPVSRRELGAGDFRDKHRHQLLPSDDNGFRPNAGAPYSFAWNSPPWATSADSGPVTRGRGAGPAPAGSTIETRQDGGWIRWRRSRPRCDRAGSDSAA